MPEETTPDSRTATAGSKKRRNMAAAGLLIAALVVLTVSTLWITLTGIFGDLTGETGAGRFLVMVLGTNFDARIWMGITGILAVGVAYVAGGGLPDKLFYAIVILAALSLAASVATLVLVSNDEIARHLYNFAPERIADADGFKTAANWVIGEVSLWLVGVISMQVGVRKA